MAKVAICAVFAYGHLAAAFRSGQTLRGVGGRVAGSNATELHGVLAVAANGTGQQLAANATQLQGAVALAGNATELRGWSAGASNATLGREAKAPCQCEPFSSKWSKCARTVPKCIFIDLGAADGNSFEAFLSDQYGPVSGCPSGQWEAVLVEANPRFDAPLQQLAARFPGSVHSASSTAAYMCEAKTSFYLDTLNHHVNYWGSSMSAKHPDAMRSGLQKVTVPMQNLNRILFEKTIPGDWVMVKMDIEGAEWDMMPCLASSPPASLIDRLYVEEHAVSWGLVGTTWQDMQRAKAELRRRGVDIPVYNSPTL